MSQGSIKRIAERERLTKLFADREKAKKVTTKKKTAKQKAAANDELGSLDELVVPVAFVEDSDGIE